MTSKISQVIIEAIKCGMSVKDAFDMVLGQGAYEKLAGEVYDALNK